MDHRVEKILQMMREDVRGELSLAELAQSVNLSVWRLSHIFKTDVGMPPIRYLKLLRMERAKVLLETSYLSVKEIAFRVGLNDESHFVRDFKTTFGSTPTSYRVRIKNGSVKKTDKDESTFAQSMSIASQSILPTLIVSLSAFL